MSDLLNIKELQQRIALYEDMEAYHALYDHFYNNLHFFCFYFVKSHEAAEEIVSDVFTKLWQIRNQLPLPVPKGGIDLNKDAVLEQNTGY